MEILDVDVAVGRPGRTPEQWEHRRFGAAARAASQHASADEPAPAGGGTAGEPAQAGGKPAGGGTAEAPAGGAAAGEPAQAGGAALSSEAADAPIAVEVAAPRPRETWLRFTLPSGTRGFRLGLRHLAQQVWIDDVEVTVAFDDGTIELVHPVDRDARLTIRCLRSLEHHGIEALTSPLQLM